LAIRPNGNLLIFAAVRSPDSADALKSLANSPHPSPVHIIRLDAADDKSIAAAVENVQSKLAADAGLDVLVNNAGILEQPGSGATFPSAKRDAYQRHFDVNATSPVLITQAFLPLLKKAAKHSPATSATVINISSTLGSIGDKTIAGSSMLNCYAYRMTKSALNQFTKTAAIDLAAAGINVVSFCPGWVQTELGGAHAPLKVEESVADLLATFDTIGKQHSGAFLNRFGDTIPF